MAAADFPLVLGGSARPLGCVVSFLDRPLGEIRDAVVGVHGECQLSEISDVVDGVWALDPMEAPWSRELLVDCGLWTAYINNGIGGGDASAIAPALSRGLQCRCVVAEHIEPHGPGHASTQLWLLGPDGEPPLNYVRTIAAHATDGHWQWLTSGIAQPFESVDSYSRRRVRDRFDRELLVRYLADLDIHVDEPEFFGSGVLVQQVVEWERRAESVASFRRQEGWD